MSRQIISGRLSGDTRARFGCLTTWEADDGKTLTLHRTGPTQKALREAAVIALTRDESYRLVAYSTPETIFTDLDGGRADYQQNPRRGSIKAKQWQAIVAAKLGPCRVCNDPASNGRVHSRIQMHHVVPRGGTRFGDDTPDNIVPLCPGCHHDVTLRDPDACHLLVASLTEPERTYARARGGASVFERVYGVRP